MTKGNVWHYLTFIPEAEHDGRVARERTEIYLKALKQAREFVKSITIPTAYLIGDYKSPKKIEKLSELDEIRNVINRLRNIK